jgi:site-specific DNA-methyltransferase (adenine-specific)
LYGWKDGAAHSWYSDRKQSTVLEFDRPKRSDMHPTMKSVDMLIYLIKNSSKRGDLVADFFGGSGSTLIAAEQTGRKAYLMELDEKYCDVIRKRWAGEGCSWEELTKANMED